jgi:hypothetical protein
VQVCVDYWEIKSRRTLNESVYFKKGKVNYLIYMQDDICVGVCIKDDNFNPLYRCAYQTTCMQDSRVTKAELMARLDKLGVKYNWLKYLKDEN